jgi:hypothetical protein
MITKEFIEAFFHNKSSIEDRFVGFNFLYNETKELKEYETTKFDETTIRWIKEKEADLRSRITYLTETKSLENYDNINENIAVINQLLESQFIKKSWLNTVRKVQESYCQYLNEMKYNNIKYIIVSEAPLLKFSEDQFSCNYILDKEIQSAGSYRTAPYHALNKILNENYNREINNEISADDLITLCKTYGIAFMDLIPIPLPELNTKLREHWSINQQYFIEQEKPRVITFLEIAFKYFIDNTECEIDPNVKIALMMPPKASLGILNFFINDKKTDCDALNKLKERFIVENKNIDAKEFQDRSMRLHKAVVMSGAGGPNEKLIYNVFK